MKLSLLRDREAFDDIFQESVAKFLRIRDQWSGDVRWASKALSGFNCNDHLNVIYHSSLPRKELADLTKEYSWNKNRLRRVLQTVYVYVTVRWPLERILRNRLLIIEPCPTWARGWVFIPGNHSIRAVDVYGQTCRVFPKIGFHSDYIRTEIETRQSHSYLPTPQLISVDAEFPYYEEVRVSGMPLNRLDRYCDVERGVEEVRAALALLYSRTRTEQPADRYIQLLSKAIEENSETLARKWGNDLAGTVESVLRELLDDFDQYSLQSVSTVQSHGDLQPANILVSSTDVYLIDWEYSAQRSIFYDALVFTLQSRFPTGLSARFLELRNQLEHDAHFSWTGAELTDSVRYYLSIFLMEELALKIEELTSPSITGEPTSLMRLLHEIRLCLRE